MVYKVFKTTIDLSFSAEQRTWTRTVTTLLGQKANGQVKLTWFGAILYFGVI